MSADDEIRIGALTRLVAHTGASGMQLRYSGPPDDEAPTVWFGVALYPDGRWEVGAGKNPRQALVRLCEALIDGGTCTHCSRPTAFDDDFDDTVLEATTAGQVCWYLWDPELATYRRGCAGEQL